MIRFILVIFLLLPVTATYAALETYVIDPSQSYVSWQINHFGFSHPSGKWFAEGFIYADESNPRNSKVNVTIKMADMVTGHPKLDEHLKGETFFDVKKYPTATFLSNKIEMKGKDTAKVYGILNLHGIAKPIVLNVKLNKLGDNPMTQIKTAGFSASADMKRSDFGVDAYIPGLSDEVQLQIEVEAKKQ